MAWSPLGGGEIFNEANTDEKLRRVWEACKRIAKKHGNYGVDQILLAFLLKHPSGILPVLGTSKFSRLETAIEAEKIELTTEDWFELWVASAGEPIP